MLFDQPDFRNIPSDCSLLLGWSENNRHLWVHCHPRRATPDGLLPYSSAGYAVLPHHIPRDGDITGERHETCLKKMCMAQGGRFKNFRKRNTKLATPPPIAASRSTVCTHSLLDHKLQPTSFTFHRENPQRNSFLCYSVCAFLEVLSAPVCVWLRDLWV